MEHVSQTTKSMLSKLSSKSHGRCTGMLATKGVRKSSAVVKSGRETSWGEKRRDETERAKKISLRRPRCSTTQSDYNKKYLDDP
jgi:hypothetical protein